MVCEQDWEPRNMSELIRVQPESSAVPWARLEPDDVFLQVCYPWDRSCYADLATADCALADNQQYTYAYLLALKTGT
jgi:hypothetical protein